MGGPPSFRQLGTGLERKLEIPNTKEYVENVRDDHCGRFYVQIRAEQLEKFETALDRCLDCDYAKWNPELDDTGNREVDNRTSLPRKTRSPSPSATHTQQSKPKRRSPPSPTGTLPVGTSPSPSSKVHTPRPAPTEPQETRPNRASSAGTDPEPQCGSPHIEDITRETLRRTEDPVCHAGLHGSTDPSLPPTAHQGAHLIFSILHFSFFSPVIFVCASLIVGLVPSTDAPLTFYLRGRL